MTLCPIDHGRIIGKHVAGIYLPPMALYKRNECRNADTRRITWLNANVFQDRQIDKEAWTPP